MKPFRGIEPTEILTLLRRQHDNDRIESIFFRAVVPCADSFSIADQWRRFKLVVGCLDVYQRLGINSLPSDSPTSFHRTEGWEVLGTLTNLLLRSGCVDDGRTAMEIARLYLNSALNGQIDSVEAYACYNSWCDWFLDELGFNATCLVGLQDEWWLIVVTEPYC